MRGIWVRKPIGATSVVFVHGILSSGETCWKHQNGTYWPELLKSETELDHIGIYVYSYQTGFKSGTYSISAIVDDLKERFFTVDNVANSKKIVFVCHSMGGIVVRQFIVERAMDLIEQNIEVGLYLVASPSLGARYANWLEPIAKFAGHAQAKALRFSGDNQWLNHLDKSFWNLLGKKRLKIEGKELLEDKFITLKFWFRKQVVEPFAGHRYFPEPYPVPQSDHFSIAKPQDKDAIQHKLLLAFIKNIEGTSKSVDPHKAERIYDQPPENDSNSPALPASYADRKEYEMAIASVLWANTKRRIKILLGPSGSGKTTLVAKFFAEMSEEYGKTSVKWIDCRLTFQKPSELEKYRLVVFDNLPNRRHPLLDKTSGWLPTIKSDAITIITTTDRDVATVVQSITGTFNDPATVVELKPFNDNEVSNFIEKAIPPSEISKAKVIAAKLGGSPLALQLLKDVLIDNNEDFLTDKLKNFDGELSTLLRLWLNFDDQGDLEKVLKTLCSIPLVGMDREALAFVLQMKNLEGHIKTLRDTGLISEVSFAGLSTHQDNLLIAHEIVRNNFTDDEIAVSTKRKLYQELLGTRLEMATNSGKGVLTCIDAWLSAWEDVFDFSNGGMDEARYKTLEEHLHKLTASNSCWETALHCVPDYVKDRFRNPDKESCATIIGVAHMVKRLPKSRLMANVIFIGGSNYDFWARAVSLSAAAEQWRKLGDREKGKEELKNWLTFAYQKYKYEGNSSSSWSDPLGLDFLAAITGVIKLGNINDGMEIIQAYDFLDRFPNTTLTHLALVVLLAKNGVLNGPKSKAYYELIYDWTASVNLSPPRVQKTAFRIGEYLLQQYQIKLSILRPPIISSPGRNATLSLDIAYSISDDNLINFVRQEEDDPKTYI